MKLTVVVLTLLQGTSAHSIWAQVVSGTTYPIGYAISQPTYDGPITDVTSSYIACNGGPNPVTGSANIITVNAGSTVSAIWRHTLTSASTDVIDSSHKGPYQAYLKKANNATTDGPGSGWFKIQAVGYTPSSDHWGTQTLMTNGGIQTITIPSCIASGRYLLRAELLALHGASSSGGAQFYQECAQLNIVGGSGSKTPSTVSLPGAYKATDPGILINIYSTITSYTIPGPTPFAC